MSAMTTQEKIEEFWGKCFHPATKVVYTTDHYKVGKEEFISIVSGFINQARKEAAIEELERLKGIDCFNEPYTWQGDERPGKLVAIRIKQLKEGKDA